MNPHRKAWLTKRSKERYDRRAQFKALMGRDLPNRRDLDDFRADLRKNPWVIHMWIDMDRRSDDALDFKHFDIFQLSDKLRIVREEKARLIGQIRQLEVLEKHYQKRNFGYLRNKHKREGV